MSRRPSWLAPEVIQSSAMDCGPAALKSLLQGFGIHASYGRLREACQTSVDGTSIDTLEDAANELGLDAEQVLLPPDHLLFAESDAPPALAVVVLPSQVTHFVVIWRRHGPWLQLMDPASGRRWVRARQWLDELYVHEQEVDEQAWREWSSSDGFLRVLDRRLAALGVSANARRAAVQDARAIPDGMGTARLDGAARLLGRLVDAGGLGRGAQASALLPHLVERADTLLLPTDWSARPAAHGLVRVRGAVLVRVRGRREGADERLRSPELSAALAEPPERPAWALVQWLRQDGLWAWAPLLAALFLASFGVLAEALLFRALFDIGHDLALTGQRLAALGAVLGLGTVLLAIEWHAEDRLLGLGRRLETKLRAAFLARLPRIGERYFGSRLNSDMAERAHSAHKLRQLPELGGRVVRTVIEAALTAAGIAWLRPQAALLALLGFVVAVGVPLCAAPLLIERDLKLRTHLGALGRFHLDALLGLVAARAHSAERALKAEHDTILSEWARASLSMGRAATWAQSIVLALGFALAVGIVAGAREGSQGTLLLLAWWGLGLPLLGQRLLGLLQEYPVMRNTMLRLLEPLSAPTEEAPAGEVAPSREPARGVAIGLSAVTVRASGHTILEGIELDLEPGSHVAVIGRSGAGKSSLLAVLQGFNRPTEGEVTIDGEPIERYGLARLRGETSWIDPAVRLWNRTLLDNLLFGSADGPAPIGEVVAECGLRPMLERLPHGLQTPLGEGGVLVSGGEGQRVRLGRGFMRRQARLVLLDEPFRGLGREERVRLLGRARERWRASTLLCVTHDIGATLDFDRVVVIEGGRVVEDDEPRALAAREGSRFAALLAAEQDVRTRLWADGTWRRLRLEGGRLSPGTAS